MLKVRLIPTLLSKRVGLVKGQRFDSWRRVGSVLPAIRVYNQREVDELVLVDVEASRAGSGPDIETVLDVAGDCFVPFTVGGGVDNIGHVEKLLCAGADKVSINSALHFNPNVVSEVARRYGSQCAIASIDVRAVSAAEWRCYVHAGTVDVDAEVRDWAKRAEDLGAGEILLTSIDRDGTMEGYDLALIEAVATSVSIPVIASGGAGDYEDLVDAVSKAGASAVAAASIFHFTEMTPAGAKEAMAAAGIPVRILHQS